MPWLGAVTVPEPIQGTALRNSRSSLAGDRAGNAGWFGTRPWFEGFETGCANLELVLFGRSLLPRFPDDPGERYAG